MDRETLYELKSNNRVPGEIDIVGDRIKIFVLSLAVIINLFYLTQPDSLPSTLYDVIVNGKREAVEYPDKIDRFIMAAAPDGNILLKFENFEDQDEIASRILPLVYFRSVYCAFPRKVFVSRNDLLINKGTEVIGNIFRPDAAWLQENGVKTILTLTCDQDGIIANSVEKTGF